MVNQCDWAIEGCVHRQFPNIPLEKCNVAGCNILLHHICQVNWQTANGLSPGNCTKLCRWHHPNWATIKSATAPPAMSAAAPAAAATAASTINRIYPLPTSFPHFPAVHASGHHATQAAPAVAIPGPTFFPSPPAPFPHLQSSPSTASSTSTSMKVLTVSKKQRARSPVESTANKRNTAEKAAALGSKKARKNAKTPPINPNRRVMVLQSDLVAHMKLSCPDHAALPFVADKYPKFPFCGVVMKAAAVGNQVRGKKQHPIKFDLLPHEHNLVVVKRSIIKVLIPGEDEPEYDEKQARIDALNEECEHPNLPSNEYGSGDDMASIGSSDCGEENDATEGSGGGKKGKKKKKKKARCAIEMERFLKEKSDEDIAKAQSYRHFYGEEDNQYIEWTILQEGEEIVDDVMQPSQPSAVFNKDIPWSRYPKDMNYTDVFFDHFFPSLQGKAQVLDEYLASPHCSCHNMVVSDKIRFHRPNNNDPDFIVSTQWC